MKTKIKRRYRAEIWDIMQYIFASSFDHQIHFLIKFDSFIDIGRFKKAVDLLIIEFPLIGCRFLESGNHPFWEEAGFRAEDIVFFQKTQNINEEIQKAFGPKIDEFNDPQLRIHIIRSMKEDTLCININHMLCDGEGYRDIIYRLSTIYSRLETQLEMHTDLDDEPHIETRSGHKVDNNTTGINMGCRDAWQVLQPFNIKDKIKILFNRYDLKKNEMTTIYDLEGDVNTPFLVYHTITQAKFKMIKNYAKSKDASINDVLLTAYIRTLYKHLNMQVPAIQCVVNLRKYITKKEAVGFCNLTSTLMCNIGDHIGDGFESTLKTVKKVMDEEKGKLNCLNLIMKLEIVYRILPYQIFKRKVLESNCFPPLAMSNIGIIDKERLVFGEMKVTNAFITGSIKYKPLIQLSLSTYDNRITFSFGFHGTPSDQRKLTELLEEFEKELP